MSDLEYFVQDDTWLSYIYEQWGIWWHLYLTDGIRYLMGAGLVYGVFRVFLKEYSKRHGIQCRQPSFDDKKREALNSFISIGVFASISLLTFYCIKLGYSQLYDSLDDFGYVYSIFSFILLLIGHDTYFYWVHRLLHQPKLFRKFHRTHHLSIAPSPWAAYSFHVGEAFLMGLYTPFMILLIPLHPVILFVFMGLMIIRNALGHSGVEIFPHWWVDSPLDIFTTNTHHELHHMKFNGNFALYFTWWDRLMGTEISNYKDVFRQAALGEKYYE